MGGPAGNAVEYRDVTFAYARGEVSPAVERITLDVPAGQRLGVLGPNGGGKSTLLKLTLGLLRGYGGTIRVFGVSPEEARRQRLIGYVPQRNEAEMAFPISVRQAAAMSAALGVSPWKSGREATRGAVDEALALVGISDLAERAVGSLSGGQLQRAMIARAVACRPRMLLLDEPTVGIDVAGQQKFGELLKNLHDALGLTIIVVSHDIRTIAAGSDRVACLSRTLHSHVAPEGLTPAVLAEVFRHDVAAIFGGDIHVHAHPAESCPIDAPVGLTTSAAKKEHRSRKTDVGGAGSSS
jgi:ABC-type Mn2+/Zn2+ transport system ATPase subunit